MLKNIFTKAGKARTIGGVLVILLTTTFLTKTLFTYYNQLQVNLFSLLSLRTIISFILFLGYFCLRALSWKSLVHFLGESINKKNSLYIWFFSEATRYIPGNIWSFASRAYLARLRNISDNASLLILPVEVTTVVSVTTILSLFALIKNLERLPVNSTFYIVLISPPIILLGILFLQKTIKRLLGKLFKQNLNLKALLTALALQILSWSLYSIATIILVSNLEQVENPYLLFSSALLAWLVGYLSFVTPMGLGVRESAFVLLTGTQIGIAQATIIAVLSRVILIVAELTILAFLFALNKFNQNKTRSHDINLPR